MVKNHAAKLMIGIVFAFSDCHLMEDEVVSGGTVEGNVYHRNRKEDETKI